MAQIVQGQDIGERIGAGFGRGISEGLQQLAQQKLTKLAERNRYERNLKGLKALRVSDAEQLAHLDDKSLEYLIKSKLEEPSRKAYAESLRAILGGESAPEQQQPESPIEPEGAEFSPENVTPEQREQLSEYLRSPLAQQSMKADDILKVQNFLGTQQAPVAQAIKQKQPIIQPELNERQATELAKIGIQRQKEERTLAHKQKLEANKETKKYYDQVLTADKAARESDDRLNKMEKLVKKGSLPWSGFYSALKNIEETVTPAAGAAAGSVIGGVLGAAGAGIPTLGIAAGPGGAAGAATGATIGGAIGGIVSPIVSLLRTASRKLTATDTEEFEKLSNQFISGAKAVFGSRITDADLKAYMAQVPTLANTDEGKLKIIEDMKIANKAERVRAKAMKEIIKEYGYRPEDLPILVEERAGKELDRLSKEFLEV